MGKRISSGEKDLYYGIQMAIPMLIYVIALISPMFIGLVVEVDGKDYLATSVKFLILALACFYLIPLVIGIPTRKAGFMNLVTIGLLRVKVSLKDVLLGIGLGLLSLTFMWLGTYIVSGTAFELQGIDPKQIYFSLVPGIFEEVIFRGFIMIALIRTYKSYKKAMAFQVFLFAISHVGDLSLWGIIDVLTVSIIAIALTYIVFRTGHLYTAIIVHFIHDAFLFVVQKPGGVYEGTYENLVFYGAVWVGMIVIMLVTKAFTETNNMQMYKRELML